MFVTFLIHCCSIACCRSELTPSPYCMEMPGLLMLLSMRHEFSSNAFFNASAPSSVMWLPKSFRIDTVVLVSNAFAISIVSSSPRPLTAQSDRGHERIFAQEILGAVLTREI